MLFCNSFSTGASAWASVINAYSTYLIKKLQFHQIHPQFEGNFSIDTFIVTMAENGRAVTFGDGTPLIKLVKAGLIKDQFSLCFDQSGQGGVFTLV